MNIKILKAFNGDSILINFVDDQGIKRNILIDGGTPSTFENRKKKYVGDLKNLIGEFAEEEKIDTLIVTHFDDDHIGGILHFLHKQPNASTIVKNVWFNSGKLIGDYLSTEENETLSIYLNIPSDTNTSVTQAVNLNKYLKDNGIEHHGLIKSGDFITLYGLKFFILSPNRDKLQALQNFSLKKNSNFNTAVEENDYSISLKEHILNDSFEEDAAPPNGGSIAFILEYNGKNMLFLADSHPSVVCDALRELGYSKENKLKAEFVKLSHHGSKFNNSRELFELIETKNFIVSTNGLSHNHPNKQLLARLISVFDDCNIWFNYPCLIDKIFTVEDFSDFPNFKAIGIDRDFKI